MSHMVARLDFIASCIEIQCVDGRPTALLSLLDDCTPFTGFLPDDPFYMALSFVISERYNVEEPSELRLTQPNHVAALFHWHLVSELLLMLPHEDQTDRHISGWGLKTWMTNSLLKLNYDMCCHWERLWCE